MPYECAVALEILAPSTYTEYRKAMTPLLESYGGGFRYDFTVAETLRSESKHPIHRVFLIYFRDQAAKESFFSDPSYLEMKKKFFTPSVGGATILAEYER